VPPMVASGRRLTAALVGFAVLLAAGIAIAWTVGGDEQPASGAESEKAGSESEKAGPESEKAGPESAGSTEAAPDAPSPAPPPVVQPPSAGVASRFDVAVTVVPATAIIELDGVEVGRGAFRTTLPVDGTRHILTVRADGYEEVGLDFTDRPPPPRVVLDRARDAPARAGTRPGRRPAATSGGKRPVRQRAEPPRTQDREPAVTDNPDPWAQD